MEIILGAFEDPQLGVQRRATAIVSRMTPPLDFDNTMRTTGTLAELVEALRELAEGWSHLARDDRAEAALAGAEQLLAGDCSVQVGHTLYVVTDAGALR